jgi:hypothetical protein
MHKYSEVEIKKVLEFIKDTIYVVVGGQAFEQSVGIPMGTSSASLLADLFCIHMRRNSFKSFYMRRKKILLWSSIRHFDISITFYLLTIINSIHTSIRYIYMNWKSKKPQSVLHLVCI